MKCDHIANSLGFGDFCIVLSSLQVDPLFQKMSATFDEGGTEGLLLYHLNTLDNTCSLVLDASTVVNAPDRRNSQTFHSTVDLSGLKGMFQ